MRDPHSKSARLRTSHNHAHSLCASAAIITGDVHAMLAAVHLFEHWRGLADSVWIILVCRRPAAGW